MTPKGAAVARSSIVFGTHGGFRRLFDPDEREHLTVDKWFVGTTMDTALGAFFPSMGRVFGNVLAEPNTAKAAFKHVAQSLTITGGMTATQIADAMYNYGVENPDLTLKDIAKHIMSGQVSWTDADGKYFIGTQAEADAA